MTSCGRVEERWGGGGVKEEDGGVKKDKQTSEGAAEEKVRGGRCHLSTLITLSSNATSQIVRQNISASSFNAAAHLHTSTIAVDKQTKRETSPCLSFARFSLFPLLFPLAFRRPAGRRSVQKQPPPRQGNVWLFCLAPATAARFGLPAGVTMINRAARAQ